MITSFCEHSGLSMKQSATVHRNDKGLIDICVYAYIFHATAFSHQESNTMFFGFDRGNKKQQFFVVVVFVIIYANTIVSLYILVAVDWQCKYTRNIEYIYMIYI